MSQKELDGSGQFLARFVVYQDNFLPIIKQ